MLSMLRGSRKSKRHRPRGLGTPGIRRGPRPDNPYAEKRGEDGKAKGLERQPCLRRVARQQRLGRQEDCSCARFARALSAPHTHRSSHCSLLSGAQDYEAMKRIGFYVILMLMVLYTKFQKRIPPPSFPPPLPSSRSIAWGWETLNFDPAPLEYLSSLNASKEKHKRQKKFKKRARKNEVRGG